MKLVAGTELLWITKNKKNPLSVSIRLSIITLCHRQFRCNLFSPHCFANFFFFFFFFPSSPFLPPNDDSYERRAIEISHSYRHRLSDPLETAVWWVEYVAENGGNLLQSRTAVKLNPLYYHSLDVILVLLCSIALTISLVIKAIRRLWMGISRALGGEKLPLNAANKKHN